MENELNSLRVLLSDYLKQLYVVTLTSHLHIDCHPRLLVLNHLLHLVFRLSKLG